MASEPHILVVEDDRDIREPLAQYLSKQGLRVSRAENAAAARLTLSPCLDRYWASGSRMSRSSSTTRMWGSEAMVQV